MDWEPEAAAMLGRFRLAAARHPDDPDFCELIAELHDRSTLVRQLWPRHDVAAIASGSRKLRHPRLGPIDYTHVVLAVADDPEQSLLPTRRRWTAQSSLTWPDPALSRRRGVIPHRGAGT
jgi:MmyB-like transcription regulator ligand binding domain